MRYKSLILVMLLLAGFLPAGCATIPAPRLQESGLNSRFVISRDMPFDEYVRQSRRMIEKARIDINEHNRDAILAANMPFELKPDEKKFPRNANGRFQKGILLIHGLTDSPYFFKPLARYLQERGFLVRAILLPGHGTVPGDLLSVQYQAWIEATQYGAAQLQQDAEHIFLGGFSTGGALCMLEALNNRHIRGLILFAPAAGIKSPWAFMADFLKSFRDWLGSTADDRDYAKYESMAINGGAQVYRLTRELDGAFAAGGRLDMPVFVVGSKDDITVDTKKIISVFDNYITSPKSLLLLYGREDWRHTGAFAERIVFRQSYLPDERIVDYSHISLLMPPDDPRYGKNGDYRYCLHYQGEREKRMSCLHEPQLWQGEISPENLSRYTLRRLTYNPRFAEMIAELDRFLTTASP